MSEHTIEIPEAVVRSVGLDHPTGIICNDLIEFTWVGPDVRGGADGTPLIGHLPERLWHQVINKIVERRVAPTRRPS